MKKDKKQAGGFARKIFPAVVKVSVAFATETGDFETVGSKISDEIPKGVAHVPTT